MSKSVNAEATPNDKKGIKPVCLIILDGWGHREDKKDNAVRQARTPFFDEIWKKYPHTLLEASGHAVGLPDGQMGNSEIGHTTIGAGKVIDTELVRIKKAIDTGEFEKNPAFLALFDHVKKNNSTLHVQGLIGNGGVHAHSDHLFAFLRAAKNHGIQRVAIHAFTDGRDTAPQSAGTFMKDLEKVLEEVGIGFIATVAGRFYAMDRDNNWDRLEKVEKALFECKGNVCEIKPSEKIEELYKGGMLDEHLEPIVCLDKDGKGCSIQDHDGVFFFNFRADRARMLSQKMLEKQEKNDVCFVTLTQYSTEFKCLVAFPNEKIDSTLALVISKAGMTQSHIAETEKFPHATYFLNGGVEKPYPGEKHIMLDSHKDVLTHDKAPKMRAEDIAKKAIEEIESGVDFVFINFANADMVGHTANVPAIVEAVEEVDKHLRLVCEAVSAKGGVVFITADHGNAELNVDPVTGNKHTAHTTNPVPAILYGAGPSADGKRKNLNFRDCPADIGTCTTIADGLKVTGGLADIAPTILTILGIDVPKEMTGKILV